MNQTQKKTKARAQYLTDSISELKNDEGYKQTLIKHDVVVEDVNSFKKINKKKGFEYGYNKEHNFVCISKDGTVGEVIEVQGLRIGLPQAPGSPCYMRSTDSNEQYWERIPKPTSLDKIKDMVEFNDMDDDVKLEYSEYIDGEFQYRDDGFWFMCNGKPKYITGTHYMYLQWTKMDSADGSGTAGYREANTIFFYFWEACKADPRCYGMCYLKNRRSGFSFMASAEAVNQATITKNSRFGILSKTGADAKKMFTDKVVPISLNYPFFFKPIQSGEERPKTALEYAVPSERLSKKKLKERRSEDEFKGKGLDTSIDWKNTGDNSYDGEKLRLLVHDESGKWERPENILNNWRVTKTCLRLGRRIVGKCMMGSTSNSLDQGGDNFKKLYYQSDLTEVKRNKNDQTPSGLYALFIPMEWNFEGYFDKFGYPVFETPEEPIDGQDGEPIEIGVIEHWNNEAEGLSEDADGLNEFYRQYPRTEKHAFRDEAKNSLFNLTKIYEQIDYNEGMRRDGIVMQGSFQWENGIPDTRVVWRPNPNGRFRVTWIPPLEMQNAYMYKKNLRAPANAHIGAFGCDSYDISGVVGGGGSNGALHGLTTFHMDPNAPVDHFFLEYIARPQTAEIFFEEVLMACVFYSMPILVENNKPRLLYHLARRGYRGYSIERPDKRIGELSVTERELGGIPNTSDSVRQAHAAAIESYIESHVGTREDGTIGEMYFQKTLEDWSRFDITKRTLFDASISSGLALMATHRGLYTPKIKKKIQPVSLDFGRDMKRNNW